MSYHIKQSNGHNYTSDEIKEIITAYDINKNNGKTGWLLDLSRKLGRSAPNISRYAKEKGLTNFYRHKPVTKYGNRIKCIECGELFLRVKKESQARMCSLKCESNHRNKSRVKAMATMKRNGTHVGMTGKHHTEEYRKQLSIRIKKDWANPESAYHSQEVKDKRSKSMSITMVARIKNQPSSIYSRTTKGWREIGDKRFFFRSKWEMNVAYYIEWLKMNKQIIDWSYEEDTFWFEKIRRGVRSYTPDFKITENDGSIKYTEVKGWMDDKSKTKLKRMAKYYPKIKIELIGEAEYKLLKSQVGRLCNWE